MVTENDPEEGEEEENLAGNCKQPARKPAGESHGWAKESVARSCSKMVGNLSRYATRVSNDPEEDEEEENAAGNHKQLERNPVRGSYGWGN